MPADLFFLSCQTYDAHKPVEPIFEKHFSRCPKADGGYKAKVYQKGSQQFSASLDWLRDHQNLTMELSDDLGRTLYGLHIGDRIRQYGLHKTLLIEQDLKGHVVINGYGLSLNPYEISCLLARSLPLEWKSRLRGGKRGSQYSYSLLDRNIELKFSQKRICSTVSWSYMWLFKEEVSVCWTPGRQVLDVLGPKHFHLELVEHD